MGKKQIVQWALALAAGFLAANALCFLYERPAGWLDTPNGPAPYLWRPGAWMVHGTEGYSVSRVDENGFLNPEGILAERYVLMMGASHTQGKEIPSERRYSTLVNNHFCADGGLLYAYNISSDGHFLPTLIRHFPAAVAAFPGAGAVTIEISSTDADPQALRDARNQAVYESVASDPGNRLKMALKEGLPLLSLLKKNLQTLRVHAAEEEGPSDYATELDAALSRIRSQFAGPIVFVYHPTTTILPEGGLKLGYSETWDIFRSLCEKNRIDVIDTGAAFARLYETEHKLPYGFANTTPGEGHLNAAGHRILAEEIISYLEGNRV